MPSLSTLIRNASWTPSTLCHSGSSFEVTNTSSRGTPAARSPRPTPRSLPYAWAVSTWRYPLSIARATAVSAPASSSGQVPRPMTGISAPCCRVMVGARAGLMAAFYQVAGTV